MADDVLEELRTSTTEQIWTVLWEAGYQFQLEGDWNVSHPGRRLIGRAVTAQFLPQRPDLDAVMVSTANHKGRPTRSENQNWLVVESLVDGDVMVVDIFGKVHEGTVIGDQLGTAIDSRTGAGVVIHGGIRDLEGISTLSNITVYFRGTDPTPIRDVTLAGLNIPVRIGAATAMPGDVVLGTPSGVMFIPPQLAAKAAEQSAEIRLRDEFAKLRLAEGRYFTSQMDVDVWSQDIQQDYATWRAGTSDIDHTDKIALNRPVGDTRSSRSGRAAPKWSMVGSTWRLHGSTQAVPRTTPTATMMIPPITTWRIELRKGIFRYRRRRKDIAASSNATTTPARMMAVC